MNSLEIIFGELGISQYLDVFVDQGFDSWETILDITESDLDTLGVKLGHRRKLQRRIANTRGLAPELSLVSPTRTSIEDARLDSNRPEPAKPDGRDTTTVVKRKYRRHPKPDENAPERPPSAYVLFSNKMREDLKGRNLTFTEIAKLVGENWQSLNRAEKEPFETQAQQAKEKYNHDLADYKKTADFRKYAEYLADFRKRQALQTQEKDAAKRLKMESDSSHRGSTTRSGSSGASGTASGACSGSDSQPGSEPPPTRQHRLNSVTSTSESQFSSGVNGMAGQYPMDGILSPRSTSLDENNRGTPRGLSSPSSREPTGHPGSRRTVWADNDRLSGVPPNGVTPWLSSTQDVRGGSASFPPSTEPMPSLMASHREGSGASGRASQSSNSTSASRPPSLQTEQSSTGSVSSINLPRTPSDASLPIHALLSAKPEPPYGTQQASPPLGTPVSQAPSQPPLQAQTSRMQIEDGSGGRQPHTNGIFTSTGAAYSSQLTTLPGYTAGLPPPSYLTRGADHGYGTQMDTVLANTLRREGGNESKMDGISALLRAKEIVDRQPR